MFVMRSGRDIQEWNWSWCWNCTYYLFCCCCCWSCSWHDSIFPLLEFEFEWQKPTTPPAMSAMPTLHDGPPTLLSLVEEEKSSI